MCFIFTLTFFLAQKLFTLLVSRLRFTLLDFSKALFLSQWPYYVFTRPNPRATQATQVTQAFNAFRLVLVLSVACFTGLWNGH